MFSIQQVGHGFRLEPVMVGVVVLHPAGIAGVGSEGLARLVVVGTQGDALQRS